MKSLPSSVCIKNQGLIPFLQHYLKLSPSDLSGNFVGSKGQISPGRKKRRRWVSDTRRSEAMDEVHSEHAVYHED